jgi:hypothetical protein
LDSVSLDTRKYKVDYQRSLEVGDPSIAKRGYENLIQKYHLKSRFVPVKGYETNETQTQFVKKQSLEQKVSSVISIAGLLSSFFLLGSNITGNAIGNLSKSSVNWLGICLLAIGLIAGAFALKNKYKNKK